MKSKDPSSSVGLLLHEVARLLRRDFDRRIAHLGLTQAQWRALAYLSRHEGVSQVALAEMLEIQPMTLARQIDRLEAAGWVERTPNPEDRRAFRLHLTPLVQPVLDEIWALASETRECALAGLSPAERSALMSGLARMKTNLLDVAAPGTGQTPDSGGKVAGHHGGR